MSNATVDNLVLQVKNIQSDQLENVGKQIALNLPPKEQKALARGIAGPSAEKRDSLWSVAIWAFAIVMVGAFAILAVGTFINKPQSPIASGEVILSLFTASVGFFAGLFTPSPGKN